MTKKQRHKFYKNLLDFVVNDPDITGGICAYIRHSVYSTGDFKLINYICENGSTNFMIHKLPELFDKAPKIWKEDPYCNYWYPRTNTGWKKRIQHIFDCVNETA
jgi:hypothetical protein